MKECKHDSTSTYTIDGIFTLQDKKIYLIKTCDLCCEIVDETLLTSDVLEKIHERSNLWNY